MGTSLQGCTACCLGLAGFCMSPQDGCCAALEGLCTNSGHAGVSCRCAQREYVAAVSSTAPVSDVLPYMLHSFTPSRGLVQTALWLLLEPDCVSALQEMINASHKKLNPAEAAQRPKIGPGGMYNR